MAEQLEQFNPKYAKHYSDNDFWDKVKGVLKSAGKTIIYKALQLYYVMKNPSCPAHIKAAIIAALGYFILPIDIIPDIIPGLGFTDDLAAITAALVMAKAYVDDEVKARAKDKLDEFFGAGTSDGLE
ncbi:MAG: DUF1232 domain-containing protein [Synergistaceae bacterium]|nr:DUF1232 domain-containing protein [Synergistaceae bacterium]